LDKSSGIHYQLIAITLGLILFAGSISGSASIAFADSHDDSNKKFEKLKDILKKLRDNHDERKKCPDNKKYEDVCDRQKPKIKITSPRNNERVCSPVMITGTAEDKKTGIAQVLVRIDHGGYNPATYDPSTKEWKFTTEELDPGHHKATAKAIDLVGNEKRKSVMFKVQCEDEGDTVKLTIITKEGSGVDDPGKWTVLFQGNTWTPLQNGFSPITFTVNSGVNYRVGVADFGGVNFDEWGNGSTENPRSFSINSDTTFTAHYIP